MKYIVSTVLLFLASSLLSQSSGNINYNEQINIDETTIHIPSAEKHKNSISISGMANVKADSYVAVFSMTQVGKTMKQTDSLMAKRLETVQSSIKALDSLELYIDMVSFVPLYDIVLEKKLFSQDSYNEIPDGFEMKKNLHIHFKDQIQLSEIISICAEAEIYNLIKVDYFSKQLDDIKLQLLEEAQKKLAKRMEHYQSIFGSDLDRFEKRINDGYKVVYPIERYLKCTAYNNNAFKLKSSARYNKSNKNQASYYQAVVNKEFDFVINPVVVEPVIQVMYELNLSLFEKPAEKTDKEIILVTPNGELKPIL